MSGQIPSSVSYNAEDESTGAPEIRPSSPQKNPGVVIVDEEAEAARAYRATFLSSFTAEEEKRIKRKVDYRVLLLFACIYMIKQIDVNNASSVKVLAVGKPTNILVQMSMTSDQYNWLQSIYYISYIVFELPSGLLLKWMGPRLFQTRIVFGWGLIVACHAAAKNKEGLYALRFFLGLVDAGMFPALMTQLTSWYRSDEIATPAAWMFAINNFSGILGSLLIYGISYLDGRQGLSSWQWVFLIEGVITMAFSILVFFVIPDYPRSKRSEKWLTPREQEFLELRLSENAPRFTDKPFSWKESVETLKDPRLWSFMWTAACLNTGGYGLSWFLPTIITNLGFVSLPSNLLLLIPSAACTCISLIITAIILKKGWIPRPYFTMGIVAGEVACFAIFLATTSRGGIYTACVLGTMTAGTYGLPFWAWRTSSLKGTTGTPFAFGLQNAIGQIGGIIGPQVFRTQFASNGYKVSYGICTAAIVSGFIGVCISWYLTRNLEADVRRIHKERIKAHKEGRVYGDDDIKVYHERQYFKGLKKDKAAEEAIREIPI